MNDEKKPDQNAMGAPPRTSNRGARREPPVIEGEAVRVQEPASASAPVSAPLEAAQEAKPADNAPAMGASKETSALGAVSSDDPSGPRPVDASINPPGEPSTEPPAEALTASSNADVPPAPAPSPPPARGYGLGAVAAASLGSAALAALAVFGLQSFGASDRAPVAALEKRMADVEQRAAQSLQAAKEQAAREQVSPASLAALEKRVASVEALAANASEAARKAIAEAAARPPASAAPGAPQPGLPQSGAAQSGPAQSALAAIEARVAALDKNATGAVTTLDKRIAALESALSAPKTDERATQSRVEAAPPPDIDPLRKQIAALEARLQSIEAQAAPLADAARAADARFKGLEERIQPLAGRIDETRTQSEAERKRAEALAERSADSARVSLAQSVRAAIETGAPFAAQADALARLGVAAERLAPLREAAQNGAPTLADLSRGLAALEPKIVTRGDAADASVIDRLTTSALGLVRVRPVGEPAGDAPADVFARMSRALERGDAAGALKEWDKLPEAGRAASAQWAQQARMRVGAEEAARAILSDATQKLGRS